MAKKSETSFRENTVVPDLKKLPNSWYESIQQVAIKGTPDILLCVAGTFVALELKADSKSKIDPLQVYKLDCIVKAGGIAFRVDRSNWDEVYSILKTIARKGHS